MCPPTPNGSRGSSAASLDASGTNTATATAPTSTSLSSPASFSCCLTERYLSSGDRGHRQGADSSRLPEAVEVGGRLLLRRSRCGFAERGASPRVRPPPPVRSPSRPGDERDLAVEHTHRSCAGCIALPSMSHDVIQNGRQFRQHHFGPSALWDQDMAPKAQRLRIDPCRANDLLVMQQEAARLRAENVARLRAFSTRLVYRLLTGARL
jgi:hypothetical protein